MVVLKWLGFLTLAGVILAVLLAVLVAIKVIAIVGGMVIVVILIATALKGVYDESRDRKARAQASADSSRKSYS